MSKHLESAPNFRQVIEMFDLPPDTIVIACCLHPDCGRVLYSSTDGESIATYTAHSIADGHHHSHVDHWPFVDSISFSMYPTVIKAELMRRAAQAIENQDSNYNVPPLDTIQ